ncbi:cell envelope integrity protein TolA [Rhizobium sp. NPDC090279]|uniref:cell envelope integrity protein TolA n=1 Tax=Rhizobium sp. NPDC090279 TaxID=3364499 RepID=UPI00383B5D4A
MRLSANHCPRIGLSLMTAFAIMSAASVWAPPATAANEDRLRHSTMENIHNSVTANWLPPADMTGLKDVRVQIRFELDRTGKIIGEPKVTMTGGPENTQKAVAASALRAVLRSAPFKNLPMDKYDVWKEVAISFNSDDFGH